MSFIHSTRQTCIVLKSGRSSMARMPASLLVLHPALPLTPRRHRQADGQLSPLSLPIAQVSARLAPLVWSSVVFLLPHWSETPASAVSSTSEMSEIWRSFSPEHVYKIDYCICGHSGCAHSDVRSLNTTIVEGPIECHKSLLASRARQVTG